MSDQELTPRQEFNQALLAAQKEFPPIHKGRTANIETNTGRNYSYKYADLGDVLANALPILHKHGIALSQPPVSESGMVGVHTRLLHESGHVEDCGELLLPAGNNPQAAGSAMTYARRYAACAALGIVADEDDDGQAASVPESDYVDTVEEVMPKATNQLKADLLKTVQGDSALAGEIYAAAAIAHGLNADEAIPKSKMEAMQTEVDARATEAMSDAE